MTFDFKSLTLSTWNDFVDLFGDKGACEGCWCMTWRLKAADYKVRRGAGNKKIMHQLVKKNKPIGLLAFDGNKAVGWCAVAPREEYIRLESSKVLKPVDDKPVWSVSCFFIKKEYRRKGLSQLLLKEAIKYAKSNGATIVEGYPTEPKKDKMTDVFVWTGLSSAFINCGFKEVERRSETRPIMRFQIK